jgi:hypothetical protein
MGLELKEKMNDLIYTHLVLQLKKASDSYNDIDYYNPDGLNESPEESGSKSAWGMRNDGQDVSTHSGKLVKGATAFSQYSTYPTDLKLLNACRELRMRSLTNCLPPHFMHLKSHKSIERKLSNVIL